MNLYVTADSVGQPHHGGGTVTFQESEALKTLGPREVWDRKELARVEIRYYLSKEEPWCWDNRYISKEMLEEDERRDLKHFQPSPYSPRLAHFYAGCFSNSIARLKDRGYKTAYTAAAHDIDLSRREHERFGIPYDYPHLTQPDLLQRYLAGYLAADVVVCPSQLSATAMRKLGRVGRIEVIPHGVDLPANLTPLWSHPFTVGYLGAAGPDKGLCYLFQAWKQLAYKDALLVIAGRDSTSPWVRHLWEQYGGGNVWFRGWVDNITDFYNDLSLYVQPSVTEGFGIEILEAMAYGRAVLCSRGAGAADLVPDWYRFDACNVEELASKIDQVRLRGGCQPERSRNIPNGYPRWEEIACHYSWDKIRASYVALWQEMLNPKTRSNP